MSNLKVKYPGLKGAEQHHDLKNQPGENGDPDHAEDANAPISEELVATVEDSKADTDMAAALKNATEEAKS